MCELDDRVLLVIVDYFRNFIEKSVEVDNYDVTQDRLGVAERVRTLSHSRHNGHG